MSAQHTPGSGIEISLRIGQRVRHRDYQGQRVTGMVRGLSIDSDRVLQADIVLDTAIVIPAIGPDDREISIWNQHVPAHELAPFDEREELIAELVEALIQCTTDEGPEQGQLDRARALIAKATGSTT